MASTQKSEYEIDFQFYKFLNIIKTSIEYLTNPECMKIVQSWLEKLCSPTVDKNIRNKYLYELSIQVKSQKFKLPFTILPPDGKLQSYVCMLQQLSPIPPNSGSVHPRKLPHSLKTEYDDSWYDITDESDIASGSGDKENNNYDVEYKSLPHNDFIDLYENKILNLNTLIENLKVENNFLKNQMDIKHEELKLYNYQAEQQIHDLVLEVENLKVQLIELTNTKNIMQQNYVNHTNECKLSINMLKSTLEETKMQNLELRSIIKVLEDTLHEMAMKNHATQSNTVNTQNYKMLETKCNSHLTKMEQKYTAQLSELKNNYDKKLQEIKLKTKLQPKNKNTQTEQRFLFQKPSYDNECQDKIEQLQNSLTNLECLYKKLENNYTKQIANSPDHVNKSVYEDNNFNSILNSYQEKGLIKTDNMPSMQLINKLRQEILNLLQISRLKHDFEVQEQVNQLAIINDFSSNSHIISPLEIDITFLKLQEFYNKLLEQQMHPQDVLVDVKAIENVKREIFSLQMKKLDSF